MTHRKRGGQFLLISAVVIGLMLISISSTVSRIQSQEFQHDPTPYQVQVLKYEASKVDLDSTNADREIQGFQEMVNMLPGYSAETAVWNKGGDADYDCFNVTLERPGTTLRLRCIGES